MLNLTSIFKTTIDIDGEPIRIIVKRMIDAEYQTFSTQWNRIRMRQNRPVDRRPGEEALTTDQIAARREAEMTLDELKRHREREDFDIQESAAFTLATIREYVSVEPGQITDDDQPVTTGEQLIKAFATRDDVMTMLLAQVYLQNTLSSDDKKKLASRLGSVRSSSAPSTAASGTKPDPTADDVKPAATATTEAAMAEPATT